MQHNSQLQNDAAGYGDWQLACTLHDLIPHSGICVLIDGRQIALFYLPSLEPGVFAIANRDPIGQANVLSRGILGDIDGEPVVASPLYKQHFSLRSGACIEEPKLGVATYPVTLDGDQVLLRLSF